MGVLPDVVKFFSRALLVFGDHRFGVGVAPLGLPVPTGPEIRFAISLLPGHRVGEDRLGMEIADVAVALCSAAANSEGLAAVDNATGGMQAIGVGLVPGGFSEEDGQEGYAIEVLRFCTCCLKHLCNY